MVLDISGMESFGVQQLEDGTFKYGFIDESKNPRPTTEELKKSTPKVEDVTKNFHLSTDDRRIKINTDTLFYDYEIENEEEEEETEVIEKYTKPKKLDHFEIHLPQDRFGLMEDEDQNENSNGSDSEYVSSDSDEYFSDEFTEEEGEEEELDEEALRRIELAKDIRSRKDTLYFLHPWQVMDKLNFELDSYIDGLSERVKLIIANKIDIPGGKKNLEILKTKTNLPIFPVSALNTENLKPVTLYMKKLMNELNQREKLVEEENDEKEEE